MNISYDCETDSLYVHLTDEVGCDVDEVEPGVVVDVDANGAMVGIDIQQASQRADFTKPAVACSYREDDDLFHIRLSNKQIVREVSQDWHTNISYAEDGSIVEIVLLDAKKTGSLPLNYSRVL
jgi:uncharacterized protein YuzE